MNRNESLQLQLATIIQEGHISKATAYDTAGRVLLAFYGQNLDNVPITIKGANQETYRGYVNLKTALDSKTYTPPAKHPRRPKK